MLDCEAGNNATHLRVVMVGDFPRDAESIGGGVESVMLYLCEQLGSKEGLDLEVVTLDRWQLGNREINYGPYTTHYLEQAGMRGPLHRWANIRRIKEKIIALQPDIVHAQIAGQYSEAARQIGVPYVLTLHGVRYLEANIKTGLVNRLYRRHVIAYEERRGIKQAPHIISINPFIDECFSNDLDGRVAQIENPIADAWFDIEKEGNPVGLLYAGRITPRKDIATLLKAFQIFHQRFPHATLRIAGSPDKPDPVGYFDEMKHFIARNGISGSVTFLGSLSEKDLRAEYSANAFFVITSVLETAPMSIAQAQAAGRLVVATDAGGCRYMINSGKSGMIVPIGDAQGFAESLIKCVEDSSLRTAMRKEARADAERRYRVGSIAERTLGFYEEILGAAN